jgi:hypothetical protein
VKETKGKAKRRTAATAKPKVRKSPQIKANVRRAKVQEGVIAGKTDEQIAAEIGTSRSRVTKIKQEPEFHQRIRERVEAAADVTDQEVIGVLAQQMRGAITDVLPDDGGIISDIKRAGLGHLIKKIKVRREIEPGTLKRFEMVEVEIHSSQSAAAHLAKIMGLETLPKSNPFDDQAKASAFIAAYMSQTGHSEEKAKEQWAAVAPLMSKLIM